MAAVASINSEYGDEPNQGQIERRDSVYLEEEFPGLDSIERARVVQ